MPHVNSGGSSSATTAGAGSGGADDFASNDEVKVYKDEGDEEQRSSENLSEDKLGLVTETEEGKSSDGEGKNSYSADENSNGASIGGVKIPKYPLLDRLPFGYPLIPPYPYPNAPPLVASPGKLFSPHSSLGFYMYNNDHLSQPPPAHMGIQIDPKTGLPRHSLYGLPTSPGQLSHSLYSSDLSQMHSFDVLSRSSPSAPFSSSYPPTLPGSTLAWFGASGILPPHPGFPYPSFNHHHPIVTSSSLKQELSPLSESTENCRDCRPMPRCKINGLSSSQGHHRGVLGHSSGSLMGGGGGGGGGDLVQEKKRPYVKKPLNAYMLFMKEMRQTVIEECTLKESAAINQILGRKWHALDKSEQQKYYDMARKEKELHLQLYPGWSARDNYATHTKKKKRKRESSNIDNCNRRQIDSDDAMAACPNNRKCRARFGLDQQHQWCKACRNKKRCIWLRGDTTEDEDDFADYDNQTTVGDVDTSESVMVDGKLFKMSPGKAFLSIPDVDRLQINSVNSFLVNRNQGRI